MTGKWFGFEWREVLDEARDLFQRNDFEEATKAFEACREASGGSEEINGYLGKCYEALALQSLRDEDFTASAAFAESALSVNSRYPDLHLLAARAYVGSGAVALAKRHLHKALLLHPSYSEAKELMDNIQNSEGPQGVPDTVRQHADYLMELGEECLRQELFPEALALFQKADVLTPNYPDIAFKIASAHLGLGDSPSAEQFLIRSLSLNGGYTQALVTLAALRAASGDEASAERMGRRAYVA